MPSRPTFSVIGTRSSSTRWPKTLDRSLGARCRARPYSQVTVEPSTAKGLMLGSGVPARNWGPGPAWVSPLSAILELLELEHSELVFFPKTSALSADLA